MEKIMPKRSTNAPQTKTPLAQFLIEERQKRGWSQKQLAIEAGMNTPGTIAAIELGQSKNPRSDTMQQLSSALGVDYWYLYALSEGVTLKDHKDTLTELNELIRSLVVTHEVPTEVANSLKTMIEALIKKYDPNLDNIKIDPFTQQDDKDRIKRHCDPSIQDFNKSGGGEQ